MNGYHMQLRTNGGMRRRLEKQMMDHGQMLEAILKRLDDMAMHKKEEDTTSQIADLGGGGQNYGNLHYKGWRRT